MKNQYFNIIYSSNENDFQLLDVIHIKQDKDIWDIISNNYFCTDEYHEKINKSPCSIYYIDLKEYIKLVDEDLYNKILNRLLLLNKTIDDKNIHVYLGTSYDYRQINEEFDNEMRFLEYINGEKEEEDKKINITEDILINNGFEFLEDETKKLEKCVKELFNIDHYVKYQLHTNDEHPIIIDIDNGWNNSGRKWSVHLDNEDYETIGYADINTVWQFNTLMKIFDSKFRL